MTPIVQKLEEIYANFWGPHNLPSIYEKSYIGLMLNKYIQKLWLLLLKSKNEFFDIFKQWLLQTKTSSGQKLGYLQADNGKEFISNVLKFYYQEKSIKIGYISLYMHKKNGMVERY